MLEHEIKVKRRAISFEVLDYNNVVAQVWSEGGNEPIYCEQYTDDQLCKPFPWLGSKGEITIDQLLDYLESRCFPRTRHRAEQILKHLGLGSYSPLDIVKKTHGVQFEDYMWIRFAGEEELRYEDVGFRTVPEEWKGGPDSVLQQGRSE
ncbi:hypothetical protein [Paenibacillus jiagnxiensis]|uniref:hypothetical protein n=1 Tax=Paenibacillus jiagnxiensis TaxID=3228926 RepID=UPI0038D4DA13